MEFCEIKVSNVLIKVEGLRFSQTEGAVVDFFGVVRVHEEDRMIEGIEYEAFQQMAERQLLLIAEEAKKRHDLRLVRIQHRIGFVPAGEASLFVRVSAQHRRAAYDGSIQIVERLKIAVPIWKRPVYSHAPTA